MAELNELVEEEVAPIREGPFLVGPPDVLHSSVVASLLFSVLATCLTSFSKDIIFFWGIIFSRRKWLCWMVFLWSLC